MRVVLVLDGGNGVRVSKAEPRSRTEARADARGPAKKRHFAGWSDAKKRASKGQGELLQAAFVVEGTRAELADTAQALHAFAGRLRAKATPDGIPYDFEATGTEASEWGTT